MPCEKVRGGGCKETELRYGVMIVAMAVVILVMAEGAVDSIDGLGGTELVGRDADGPNPESPAAEKRAVVTGCVLC